MFQLHDACRHLGAYRNQYFGRSVTDGALEVGLDPIAGSGGLRIDRLRELQLELEACRQRQGTRCESFALRCNACLRRRSVEAQRRLSEKLVTARKYGAIAPFSAVGVQDVKLSFARQKERRIVD